MYFKDSESNISHFLWIKIVQSIPSILSKSNIPEDDSAPVALDLLKFAWFAAAKLQKKEVVCGNQLWTCYVEKHLYRNTYRFKSWSVCSRKGILNDLSSAKCISLCILLGVSGLSINYGFKLKVHNKTEFLIVRLGTSLFFKSFISIRHNSTVKM